LPLRRIPSETQVRILRGPLRGKKWIVGAGNHAFWAGTYEVDLLRRFADAISPGAVVYDIGANVGIYSLLASLRAGASGKVYAFEPSQRNLMYLGRHLTLNRAENCSILEAAVSNMDGTRRFSAASWDFSMGRLSGEGELVVASVTLDSCVYCESALRPPDVLKIDVEGMELEVLQRACKALTAFHPVIFLETHSEQLHAACRAFLAAKGYQMQETPGHLIAT
jgi:FkbM family methyltransferase